MPPCLAEIPPESQHLRAQAPRWAPTGVGKSRQMSEESNLTWDLCCEEISWRESTLTRDSAIYPGFSPSLSRGKSLLLLPLIMSSDSQKKSWFDQLQEIRS